MGITLFIAEVRHWLSVCLLHIISCVLFLCSSPVCIHLCSSVCIPQLCACSVLLNVICGGRLDAWTLMGGCSVVQCCLCLFLFVVLCACTFVIIGQLLQLVCRELRPVSDGKEVLGAENCSVLWPLSCSTHLFGSRLS